VDLRENTCWPYLPVDNQGDQVSCVAHTFAMALYCALQRNRPHDLYPDLAQVFERALRVSPDPSRGVSFEAVADGLMARFAPDLRALGQTFAPIAAQQAQKHLRHGIPVLVGYQVDDHIHAFHLDAEVCAARKYRLPLCDGHKVMSGHAVLLVGYDLDMQAYIARNSWGPDWGVDGHFFIDFRVFHDVTTVTDVWTLVPL